MSDKELLQRAIELCLAVYRVSDKFPANEILREKLRSAALDIAENITYDLYKGPTKESRFFNCTKFKNKILFAYFDIAAKQNWVKAENFIVLKSAYEKLYKEGKAGSKGTRHENAILSERQRGIVRALRNGRGEGANLKELSATLKLSKRTINRELIDLIAQGIVAKKGITKGAKFIMA